MNHYQLSRDYALLIRLMQTQTVLCFVDYRDHGGDILRDAAKTNSTHGNLRIQARGIEYVGSITEEGFIRQCQEQHVEFIVPQEPRAELPTEAGFYWWRERDVEPWQMVEIRNFGSRAIPHLSAYAVEDDRWGGWSIALWGEHKPIGHWIKIESPEA